MLATLNKLSRIEKISILIFILFLTAFFTFQFLHDKKETLKTDLIENSEDYSKLVKNIKSFDFKDQYGVRLDTNNLPKQIKAAISNLKFGDEIRYLVINKDSTSTYFEFEIALNDNWFLLYSNIPNSMRNPGSYESSGLIEIWGIDKNWSIMHDNDFI